MKKYSYITTWKVNSYVGLIVGVVMMAASLTGAVTLIQSHTGYDGVLSLGQSLMSLALLVLCVLGVWAGVSIVDSNVKVTRQVTYHDE